MEAGHETALYLLSEVKKGKLVAERTLAQNQSLVRVEGKLAILERSESSDAPRLQSSSDFVLRDYARPSKVLGRAHVDIPGAGAPSFGRLPNGHLCAMFAGRTQLMRYVSPGRVVLVDLQENRTLYRKETPSDVRLAGLVMGKNLPLLGEILFYEGHGPRESLRFVDLPSGRQLRASSEERPLTSPLHLKDGRVVSVLGNGTTGKVSVVDWSDKQSTSEFGSGVFSSELLPYGYYQLDERAMASGDEFVVPTYAATRDASGIVSGRVVGLKSFRLK